MKEGAHINRSLLALGNCIKALSHQASTKYTNYRDSKLTRLLKVPLGGPGSPGGVRAGEGAQAVPHPGPSQLCSPWPGLIGGQQPHGDDCPHQPGQHCL